VPVLTAAFGAYTMLEQPPSAAKTSAKKQALAKTDGIWLERNVLLALRSLSTAASFKKRQDAAHMGTSWEVARMAARREVASMGTSREAAHMAASRDLVRSRHRQGGAGRRQPPERHNLAHKTTRESQQFR
jgi:hypothetical protein